MSGDADPRRPPEKNRKKENPDGLFNVVVAADRPLLVVGLISRRLGGGRFAQSLAMIAVGLNFLFVFHYFSMNCFDVLVWALAAYLTVRIAQDGPPQLWIVLGALLGLGLENKISVLWLGCGLAVGLLATGERRWLATPWPWLAGALAAVLFRPGSPAVDGLTAPSEPPARRLPGTSCRWRGGSSMAIAELDASRKLRN